MGFMKSFELLISQIRNIFRLATTVVMIGRCRIQMFAQGLPEYAHRRTHRAFHFIEYHTLEFQFTIRVIRCFEFNAMSFLHKIEFVETSEKHCIKIHIQQIIKIFFVLTGKRIRGPVTTGERVHKGIQRTADHHEERIAHRVMFAATQSRVFKNMRDPGGIHRHGAKRHQENIFLVIGINMIMQRAGLAVAVGFDLDIQRFDSLRTGPFKCRMHLRRCRGNRAGNFCCLDTHSIRFLYDVCFDVPGLRCANPGYDFLIF